MFKNALIILGLLISSSVCAQQLNHKQGEILVQLSNEIRDVQTYFNQKKLQKSENLLVNVDKCISKSMNIWLIEFDFTTINENTLLASIRNEKEVLNAQFNHLIQPRNIPNDPLIDQQWQFINDGLNGGNPAADLEAELAWDITTGGVTVNGDTIVIVALDDGVDLHHPDLRDNLWRNHQEIPYNGIDDDENGYIDDVHGWNARQGNGNVGSGGTHGTPVIGVMGAKGNNGIGVTGVNWDVKVMMVKTDLYVDEATIITGYGYPLELRKLYNETNGEKGAFIVATNASWGLDNGWPTDAPIWCALYDSLGTVGILNCGATINKSIDIDREGDLPTTCPSNFLLSVTNLNKKGEKVFRAGFGKEHIDLGAFGEAAYTIHNNNQYGTFNGTSGATPLVTGAIGLLYSAPCPNFGDMVKENPANAALYIRELILQGVKPNKFLDSLTATGGQLNLNNSLQLLMDNCGNCAVPFITNCACFPPIYVEQIDTNLTTLRIAWESKSSTDEYEVTLTKIGQNKPIRINTIDNAVKFSALEACSEYEVSIQSFCVGNGSQLSKKFKFITACNISSKALPLDLERLTLFPNPMIDYLKIDFSLFENSDMEIGIYDASGKMQITKQFIDMSAEHHLLQIPMNHLAQGIYLIHIQTKKGSVSRKILKL